MILHEYLNLPNFDQDLMTDDAETITDMKLFNRSVRNLELTDKDNNIMPPAKYLRVRADDNYYEYMINLIPEIKDHIKEIGIQTISNNSNHINGAQLVPHTDLKRGDFCIQYLINNGGDNVKTQWWHETNHNITRPPWTSKLNYNNLNLIDEINWEPNKWGIFRTDVIHSVINVMTTRIAFAVGIEDHDDLYDQIINKYKKICDYLN